MMRKYFFIFIIFSYLRIYESTTCPYCYSSNNGLSCYSTNMYGYNCNNCKPKYGTSSNCYLCPSLTSGFYTIDGSGNCQDGCSIGTSKIIDNTNECTSIGITQYTQRTMGSVYYIDTTIKPEYSYCEPNTKICTCNKFYYKEQINNKLKITCVGPSNDPSNTLYKSYNPITYEFFKNCPAELNHWKIKELNGKHTRCTKACEPEEFNVAVIDVSDGSYAQYCVDSCADTHTPSPDYKYKYIYEGYKSCLKICPDGTYKSENSSPKACLPLDQCNFYSIENSGKYCLNSCLDSPSTKHYHISGSKECLAICSGEYKYNRDYICYREIDCNYIDGNSCKIECTAPNPNHDENSNICKAGCSGDNPYHTQTGIVCYSSCSKIPGDYKYENGNICYDYFPTCEAFYREVDGVFRCTTKALCINHFHLKYFFGYECRDNCDGYFQIELIEGSLIFIKCYASLNDALADTARVKFCDISQKKCWSKFPIDGTYYIDSVFSSSTTNQYELVRECFHFYYLKAMLVDSENRNWCVDNCKIVGLYFIRGNKKCYGSCNEIEIYYYDEDNNECLESCELRPDKKYSYPIQGTIPNQCLLSCDINQGHFHNYDSHICLTSCDANNNYLYFKNTNDDTDPSRYKCFPSCLDIPPLNGPTIEIFRYSSMGNICSVTMPPDCDYFYSLSDGVKKCTLINQCQQMNYLYLIGKECVFKCDDNYYKIEKTITVPTQNFLFKKCYPSPTDCYEGENAEDPFLYKIYYNKELKQCYKDYQSNYYIKIIDATKSELVGECDNYYYEITDNNNERGFKYCVEQCITATETRQLFFVKNQKKCVESCIEYGKHYYDPTTNECLDTCVGSKFEYSFPLSYANDVQPCLIQCPNLQPYLIKSVYNQIRKYECFARCPFNTTYPLMDIKTKECRQECLYSDDYKVVESENMCYPNCKVDLNFLYINSDTYECALACPSELRNQVYLYTNDIYQKDVYICKSDCIEPNKYRQGANCLPICPQTHNYIGFNNICKETCNEDPNGHHYFQINEYDNPSPSYKIYKCVSSCEEAINDNGIQYNKYEESNPKECLRDCPNTSPFYLESKEEECLEGCPYNYPFYRAAEKKCLPVTICESSEKYFVKGQCVNLDECISPQINKRYVDSRNICLDSCPVNDVKEKIEYYSDTYKCLRNCGTNKFRVRTDNDDFECVDDCPEDLKFIGKDNICKSSCDEIDGIYYHFFREVSVPFSSPIVKYKVYKCVDGCKPEYDNFIYRAANNGRECYAECPENYKYLSPSENLCYDDCLKSIQNPFTVTDLNRCGEECNQLGLYIYWGVDKVCRDSCNTLGDTKIIDPRKNQCVEKCDPDYELRYELDGKCVYSCDTGNSNKKRYSTADYKCKPTCGEDEYVINENICVKQCDRFVNIIQATGEKECVDSCTGTNKFYYPNQKKCLSSCYNNDKVVEGRNICVNNCNDLTDSTYYLYQHVSSDVDKPYDRCVLNCPENKQFINGDICVAHCPIDGKKFYVQSDNNPLKKCLSDCPEQHPYYTIETPTNDPTDIRYICKATCPGYFVPNPDTSIIAKFCLNDCQDQTYDLYKYRIIDGDNKKCYTKCPSEAKYHFDFDLGIDNFCYEKCPGEKQAPYHKKGSTICQKLSEFNGGFILYDIKEWTNDLEKCPEEYPFYSVTDDDHKVTICLKKCDFIYYDEAHNEDVPYGYLTPYNSCVRDCEESYLLMGKNFKNDEESKKCVCKNLFYINDTFQIECFPGNLEKCKDSALPNYYPIPLYNTKQCLKACNGERILTPYEDECYEKDTPCSDMVSYSNTYLIIKANGQLKCECSYKFFFSENTKVCLAENDACPLGKSLLIPDTLECVDRCPSTSDNNYPYQFQNFCLRFCPANSRYDPQTYQCHCTKFWYETSPGQYQCLDGNCLEGYPVYADSNLQCLKECRGSSYQYLYGNKCYDNCDFIENLEVMDSDSPLADKKCDCPRPWFYDIQNGYQMNCPDDSIKKCRDFDRNVPFMIDSTRQCVEECPPEYPYYFNHRCFTSCESANEIHQYNVEKVEGSYECGCPNLWKIDPNDSYEEDKICFDKNINECPPYPDDKSTTYLILRNKQCVKSREKCPSDTFKFNFICYDKCPEFTIKGKRPQAEDNLYDICVCDKDSYRWLDYEKYGNTYYQCGLESCPDKFVVGENEYIMRIFLENENKCVRSCLEDGSESNAYLYSFRGKCVLECPTKTKLVYDECIFIELNNITEIDSLDKLKEAANVQAKELYAKSAQLSGFLMNKFDASLQIYSVDKFDSYKDLSMKSNLTYIDLGTCLEKIYTDKNLNESDKILIAKYDLLNRMQKNTNGNSNQISTDNKFLINQVEYEFYLESTMEKIEGSICSPYEIQISYPIFFSKNKFNNFETGFNENNYLKQFKMGKELYEKDPKADSFNKDNKIYKDQCYGVEINGKDIVFEERYNILYPNNISLCESNCTMNNTDFDLERINCMCTYKEIFDFYRVDLESNDILHDPNFELPSQSKANVEIIKCFNQMEFKRDLLKNEAFYFSSVVALIQVVTAVVSVIQGVKVVSSFTQGMFNLNGAKVNIKGNNKSNVVSLCSTNRLMNNPPRKGNNGKDDDELDEENKKNIVVKKNNVINNNHPIRVLSKYDGDDNSNSNMDYNPSNYNPYSRPNFPKNKKRINLIDENENKTRVFSINNKSYNVNIFQSKKAEFIPPQYNFKFFKPTDKGVVKQIPRSQISFKIWPSTKYLLEMKKDVQYGKNYLKGPFYEDQNIIEIIDENGTNSNQTIKINNDDMIEGSDTSNIPIAKKVKNIFRKSDLFQRDDYYNVKKRTISYNINKQPKNLINVRKISPIRSLEPNTPIEDYEMKKEQEMQKVDNITSIYTLMKREHTYLRMSYEFYLSKIHPGILPTILAEICDKIYLIKTLVLLKKFEVTSVYISLYIFYHILLLSLLCGFFTINTIKKIWTEDNFPNIRFYLLYGFLANIIDWIFYKIFIILLDNQDRIRSLVKLNEDYATNKTSKFTSKENEDGMNNEVISTNNQLQQKIEEKYDELMKKIKIQLAIFYIVNFLLTLFFFMYLTSFFAIYTGTKKLVLKAYYISIIEIVIIKFVYGLCLGSLRIAAEVNKFKTLYNFVYICDKYFA